MTYAGEKGRVVASEHIRTGEGRRFACPLLFRRAGVEYGVGPCMMRKAGRWAAVGSRDDATRAMDNVTYMLNAIYSLPMA